MVCAPSGTPISPVLGFTFCQKITETSVSELRDQPPSCGRSGALCPCPPLLQRRNRCLWGCGDGRMLWHGASQPGTIHVPGDLPGMGETAWHDLWLRRASAWHRRAILARSMARELVAAALAMLLSQAQLASMEQSPSFHFLRVLSASSSPASSLQVHCGMSSPVRQLSSLTAFPQLPKGLLVLSLPQSGNWPPLD